MKMKCQKNIGLTIEYYFWRIILGSDEEGGNTVDNFSPAIEQSLSRDGFTNKGLSCHRQIFAGYCHQFPVSMKNIFTLKRTIICQHQDACLIYALKVIKKKTENNKTEKPFSLQDDE